MITRLKIYWKYRRDCERRKYYLSLHKRLITCHRLKLPKWFEEMTTVKARPIKFYALADQLIIGWIKNKEKK